MIAYGVFQVKSKLWGWQILFLIEGLATMAFAVIVYIVLPVHPSKAKFLTERQKEVAVMRLLKDGSTATSTKFSMKSFFKPLSDWKFYVFAGIGEPHTHPSTFDCLLIHQPSATVSPLPLLAIS